MMPPALSSGGATARRRLPLAALAAVFVLAPASGAARPLKLSEIYQLKGYVDCATACRDAVPAPATYEEFRTHEACLTDCGLAPRLWEKNGVPPVDETDLELAILEQQDAEYPEHEYICYRDAPDDTIVVPAALCPGAVCAGLDACTEADCAAVPGGEDRYACDTDPAGGGPRCWWDANLRPERCPDVVCDARAAGDPIPPQRCTDGDGDGLPRWLDDYAGDGDAAADALCNAAAPCGFDDACAYDERLGAGVCAPRTDCHGACTAFHLELVAADDQEVIVHVFYDHTPVPARVLDLYVTYDRTALTLQDGRPLPILTLHDKQVAVSHLSDGTLRLTVFAATGTDAIPTGPIVELVFRRAGDPLVAACDDGARHDLRTDPENCGACSTAAVPTACPQGEVCSAGRCAPACVGGTRLCSDGRCHDLTRDEAACGACGTTCSTAPDTWESCIAGECLPAVGFTRDTELRAASVAPSQGEEWAAALGATDGDLWGDDVALPPPDQVDVHLRLWYGFESLSEPLAHASIPSADDLCMLDPDCAFEPDDVVRARTLARLEALQAGEVRGDDTVEGVNGAALYLGGAGDHLRLPVEFERPLARGEQDFSFSTWFYGEGLLEGESKEKQVVFSHNAHDERTRFGLALEPDTDGTLSLVLFDGDLLAKNPPPAETTVATGIQPRTWHHVAFTLDAGHTVTDPLTGDVVESSVATLYFDGAQAATHAFPEPAFACPQFYAARDVVLHEEGDVLGGRDPEFVYLGVDRSNLGRIERMDPSGLESVTILGDGVYAYRDPDYDPGLDRLLYAANTTGSFEIWLANGDGSNRRQLTVGFGDAERGIVARRPRWAPDGTGLVFESNAYDVLQGDNATLRVSHLYYIPYDPVADAPAITLGSGRTAKQLDYQARLADQTLGAFRVTKGAERHHRNARWLRGRFADAACPDCRGELLVEQVRADWRRREIVRVTIPAVTWNATLSDPLEGLRSSDDQDLRLLAAYRGVRPEGTATVTTERLLYERRRADFVADPQFAVAVTNGDDPLGVRVAVNHTPSYAGDCWDLDFDRACLTVPPDDRSPEDRNGDGVCDVTDCYPYQVRNLYVAYDPALYRPVLEDDDGEPVAPGALLAGGGKSLQLGVAGGDRAFVRVEVLSPLDTTPLGPGEVAVLAFEPLGANGATDGFGAFARVGDAEVLVRTVRTADDGSSETPAPAPLVTAGVFDEVQDAVFSPDGDRLLLSVVREAGPVLLRTEGLASADGAERILGETLRLLGFDWERQQRYYPCNWVGGYLHFQKKVVRGALRGGLDDLKLHAGLRDPDAIRSEAERGFEFLARDGLDGDLPSRAPTCSTSHAECPPYHLCVPSQTPGEMTCQMVPCDPADPYACSDFASPTEGEPAPRCTLRPDALGGPSAWVCAADCTVNAQCYGEACLNGPCLFCDGQATCVECREADRQYGALTTRGIEGCPDRRSFACEDGACTTECYSFVDGTSVYLCDPLTETCYQGRCVLLDWSWWDLAPATFAGFGEMQRAAYPSAAAPAADPDHGWPGFYAQAVDQSVPIVIEAYGTDDWGHSPELEVEVRGGPFFADWRHVARLQVHHRTARAAAARPFALTVPYGFAELRLRLVTTPYHDMNGGATGLRGADKDFCLDDVARAAAAAGVAPDFSRCTRKAPGSQYTLGYPLGIPAADVAKACRESGSSGCPAADPRQRFLVPGRTAVAVTRVEVDGGSLWNHVVHDLVCSYEGAADPNDADSPNPKVVYGNGATEQSNERDALCAADPPPAWCAGATSLVDFEARAAGFALLNCNAHDPDGLSAEVVFGGLTMPIPAGPLAEGAIVQDTGSTCTVEIDAYRSEPCYEWTGGDVSGDPYRIEAQAVAAGAVEIGLFRSFGHEEGFTSQPLPPHPLGLTLVGPDGAPATCDATGLELTSGDEHVTVALQTPDGSFSDLKQGRRYDVRLLAQPVDSTCVCRVAGGSGSMQEGGVTVDVVCGPTYFVSVTVSDLSGTLVVRDEVQPVGGAGPTLLDAPLVFTQSGTQSFATALATGDGYHVAVATQPASQRCGVTGGVGTVTNATAHVAVSCSDIVRAPLVVALDGLDGDGLTLFARATGPGGKVETGIATAGPGETEALFDRDFVVGDALELFVSTQPASPAQVCTVSAGASAVVPASGTGTAATVTCDSLPTFVVGGTVVGYMGSGLQLVLNEGEPSAETLDVPQGAPTFAFATELLAGDRYRVSLGAQPQSPAGECEVMMGEGVVTGDGPVDDVVVVCRPTTDTPRFRVGGTVAGLEGTGLRLALNNGTQRLEVAEDGAFVFDQPLSGGTDFTVTVDRQPWIQFCDVTDGAGTIWDADVMDVYVSCRPASRLTVTLEGPANGNWNGSHVKALVVSRGPNARVVAEAPAATTIVSAQATFVALQPGAPNIAVLPPGTYDLYVFVNRNGDFGPNGKPLFEPTVDRGAWRALTVTGTDDTVVETFARTELVALPSHSVLASAPADAALDAQPLLRCWWTPAGVGALDDLPPPFGAPVAAASVGGCDWSGDSCATEVVALPAGASFDVTCWVDLDEDGALNEGDLVKSADGVAPGERALTLEVQPTEEEAP